MRAGTKSVLFTVVHPVPNKPSNVALGATSNRVLKEYFEKGKKSCLGHSEAGLNSQVDHVTLLLGIKNVIEYQPQTRLLRDHDKTRQSKATA